MITVYMIDNQTRMHLPGSAWGYAVKEKLSALGHTVELADQDSDSCKRDASELRRVESLLAETGL